jgi:integrase
MGILRNPENPDKILIEKGTKVHRDNKNTIEALNNNSFFKTREMNKWGRELALYLCNHSELELNNPDPVNYAESQTLYRNMTWIRTIDNHIRKPLAEYEFTDLQGFCNAMVSGKVKQLNGVTAIDGKNVGRYVREFQRLHSVFRAWNKKYNPKADKIITKQLWVMDFKAPKVKRKSPKYPELDVEQLTHLANSMAHEEYAVRTLLAANLMARPCEINSLLFEDLRFKKDEIWVQLPDKKKNASDKVPVELWSFSKKPLLSYLKHNQFKPKDRLFPSEEPAYSKNLRIVSARVLGQQITPKTLRKIGLCLAEKLGYSREDCERIGGWAPNSEVLRHYFQRGKGVTRKKNKDIELDRQLNSEVYSELERLKNENREMMSKILEQDNALEEFFMAKLEEIAAKKGLQLSK